MHSFKAMQKELSVFVKIFINQVTLLLMVNLTIFQTEKMLYIIIGDFRELTELFPKESTECISLRSCWECSLKAV